MNRPSAQISVQTNLNLLGLTVKDQVTGYKGVVTSICFDLYGCVQAIINPGTDKDGKLSEQAWFDINRLKIVSETLVMPRPNFDFEKGSAEKPIPHKA